MLQLALERGDEVSQFTWDSSYQSHQFCPGCSKCIYPVCKLQWEKARSSLGNAEHIAPCRSMKGLIAHGIHCATLWKMCTASKDLVSMSAKVWPSTSNWKETHPSSISFCILSISTATISDSSEEGMVVGRNKGTYTILILVYVFLPRDHMTTDKKKIKSSSTTGSDSIRLI